VIIGSRTTPKAVEAATRVDRDRVRGASNPEAARAAEVIILTVPYAAHSATVQSLADLAEGKVVVDATVPAASSRPLRFERPPGGSAAEETQRALASARVVAAFHTVSANMLADLARPLHGDVLLCGDDADAKATLEALVRAIPMRPVDMGALAAAQVLEPLAALVLGLNRRYRRHDVGITVAGLDH